MNFWLEVWERKGRAETQDLKELDGFEASVIDPEKVAEDIVTRLNIKPCDRVLEIGCGAGMVAQYLDCDYVGIDYSRPLIKKHIQVLEHSVLYCEAQDLIFKENAFNKAFSFSVFHYFPDKTYDIKALSEMKSVTEKAIFVGDLPIRSHRKEHLLFKKEEFSGWEIIPGYYNEDRFNVFMEF